MIRIDLLDFSVKNQGNEDLPMRNDFQNQLDTRRQIISRLPSLLGIYFQVFPVCRHSNRSGRLTRVLLFSSDSINTHAHTQR